MIAEILNKASNLESYFKKFPLIRKDAESLTTNRKFVNWLLDKYVSAYDMNTHVLIDDILLNIVLDGGYYYL